MSVKLDPWLPLFCREMTPKHVPGEATLDQLGFWLEQATESLTVRNG